MLLRMVDSASPPTQEDLVQLRDWKVDVVAGYIGGRAAHVWSREDFERVAADGRAILPIWVGPRSSESEEAGSAEGNGCISAMQTFGLSGTVCLDVESDAPVARDWLIGFLDAATAGDLGVIVYCSPGFAQQCIAIPSLVGFWIAAWGQAGLHELVPETCAWQYSTTARWDLSVISASVPLATLEAWGG